MKTFLYANKTGGFALHLVLQVILAVLCGGRAAALVYDASGGENAVISNDLSRTTLVLGEDYSDNALTVTGGVVAAFSSAVNVGQSDSSTNNQLTVASGSALTIGDADTNAVSALGASGIFMGDDGSLYVGNDSSVSADNLYVALNSNDTATVYLSGTGTVMTVTDDVYLGYADGSDSTVTLTNAATLAVGGTLTVGTDNNSNNVVNVYDGSTLSVSSDTSIVVVNNDSLTNDYNAVNINDGGTLQVTGDADYVTVTNQGVSLLAGSTMEVGGTLTDDDYTVDESITYRLDDSISSSTSSWEIAEGEQVYIGKDADSNGLEIAGGTVQDMYSLYIGYNSSSSDNYVTVEGSNSELNVSGGVRVGQGGDDNSLSILDGASASISGNLRIGQNSTSTGNAVLVSGTNSTLTVADDVWVGNNGSENALTVESNAVLTVGSDLFVGASSDDNTFSVWTGAVVSVANDLMVGDAGDDNRVYIMGTTNSVASLTVGNDLVVGDEGTGNLFEVSSNALVSIAGDMTVGVSTGQNAVVISGTNAFVSVDGTVWVGSADEENTLTVSDQASLTVGEDFWIGAGVSSNNTVTITDSNTVLAVAGDLYVGDESDGNSLVISDAAEVSADNLYVGYNTSASNNTVSVSGDSALLSVSSDIYLGDDSAIDVEDGGTLFMGGDLTASTSNSYININDEGTLEVVDWDFETASTNVVFNSGSTLGVGGTLANTTNSIDFGDFTLAIDGDISSSDEAVWDAAEDTISVGVDTDDNTVAAIDGGSILVSNMVVGTDTASTGNQLVIEGTNSTLTVGKNLTVGDGGSSGNTFSVSQYGTAVIGKNLTVGNFSDDNEVTIGDTGSTNQYGVSELLVNQDLNVGYNGGEDNTFTMYSNSYVSVLGSLMVGTNANNNSFIVNGSNAVLDVSADLIVGTDEATDNTLEIYYGTVSALSDLIIGDSTNSADNTVYITGSNSTLNVSGDVIVGNEGTGNALQITTGAVVNVSGDVYVGMETNDNYIYIAGSNALLSVASSMYIGQEDYGDNAVYVMDNAALDIAGDLTLSGTDSVLRVDSSSTVTVAGDYTQEAYTTLYVGINTNEASLTVSGTADISSDSSIYIDTEGYTGNVGTTNSIYAEIIAAETLTIDGDTATTYSLGDVDLDYSDLDDIFVNTLVSFSAYITNDTLVVDNFTDLAITDTLGLEGSAATVGDIIDARYDDGEDMADSMRDTLDALSASGAATAMQDYYGETESANPINNVVNDSAELFLAQLSVRQDDVRATMTSAAAAPDGSAGPAEYEPTGVSVWAKTFSSSVTKDAADGYYGYEADTSGTAFGADFMLNPELRFGVAAGSGSSTVDKDSGATGEADTTYAAFYASAEKGAWMFDASLMYGNSTIEQDLGETFDTTAEYDASNIAGRAGIRRQMVGQYFIFTPEVAVLANMYDQDAYTEVSTNAYVREVEGYSELYLQSAVGANLGMYMSVGQVVFRPELSLYWLHEFNADALELNATLEDSDDPLSITLQGREEDIIRLGYGVSINPAEKLELRADMNLSTGSGYSDYDFSLQVRYSF